MATEATTVLNWFEVTLTEGVTETHTPALNDDDMWDWDSATLYEGRPRN